MNPYLKRIQDLLQQIDAGDKEPLLKAINDADKQWAIVDFKLDRTEKVKKTTAILLEETIEELEQKRKAVEESKDALQKSLEELKAAQAQLIQSEKMASLGELTAGIAHEIQNPLNFVNNFSELSQELIGELKTAIAEGDYKTVEEISTLLSANLEKITHHGKRADSIVKGMLLHSRSSSGQKEATDINMLCDEYLRLAYHGIRAKEKDFNVTFATDFEANIPKANVIPQEIGRVVLNLINNAFYAVSEKTKSAGPGYQPTVTVSTRIINDEPLIRNPKFRNPQSIAIAIADNGNGIPDSIKAKIFQPFFTTKPTGQGTGLGLSLSYDIVRAHGGEIRVATREGEGSEFTIQIPKE